MTGSGRFADTQPPTEWSKESDNILWKIELSKGYSSPVLCQSTNTKGSRLFITAEPSELLCIDADNGEVLWREKAGYEEALGAAEAAKLATKYEQFDAEKRELSKQYDTLRKSDPDSPKLEAMKEKRKEADQRRKEFERQFPREKRGGAGNAAATVTCDGERVFAIFGTGVVAAYTVEGKKLWMRHAEAPQQGFGHSASARRWRMAN